MLFYFVNAINEIGAASVDENIFNLTTHFIRENFKSLWNWNAIQMLSVKSNHPNIVTQCFHKSTPNMKDM